MTDAAACHETVDPDTRAAVLREYNHRCQGCGRCGPENGGLATLHVHHQTREPDDVEMHDPENLTLFCRACHSWLHQQTTEEEVPVEISDEDLSVLLPQDIEILRVLTDRGPLTTSEIAAALSTDLTVMAVRERLWVLMGLDTIVDARDRQVLDQDADSGNWGLVGQIEHSARGRIPNDPQVLLQRIEDEFVRRALDRGCDRDAVMDVLDLSRRGTHYKEKRARAYEFPLDAVDRRGGRPPTDEATDEVGDAGAVGDESTAGAAQQQLDAVTDGAGELETGSEDGDEGSPASGDHDERRDEQAAIRETGDLRKQLQEAIAALQALDAAM